MESKISTALLMLLPLGLFSCMLISSAGATDQTDQQEYIVYLGDLPTTGAPVSSLHTSVLQGVLGRSNVSPNLVHSYKRSFSGFVAKLTKEEMSKVAETEGVVSVFPNGKKQLQTTRSWDFMGFSQQVNRALAVERDIIIGVIDSGIWPESDSFKDEGFGPPPSKWKGTCQASSNFTCNKKIIGAKYYRSNNFFDIRDIRSPRDSSGHGTHTASTAAGGLVSNANLYGLGLGTARGGVPSARIAAYKICWYDGCYDADILAAFDDAIADGVDIISLSVVGPPQAYFEDSIAIGAFHAMRKSILTSNAAGNNGPSLFTIGNFSPWSLSVAASTIDRKFSTKVQLGNNMILEGVSINTFGDFKDFYPVVYGGNVPNKTSNFSLYFSRYCDSGSLDADSVKGKIVLCEILSSGAGALLAGAAGTVIRDRTRTDVARPFPLPATHLGATDGATIFNYVNLTSNPTARIMRSNEGKDTFAPYVASFSSRGPNPVTAHLLSPDIAAPGVDILAAWSPIAGLTSVEEDTRRSPYHITSGTSMSCPHATAVAAYVKSFHPAWSPAALKSALMTTATPMSVDINPEAELAYGAGHINPLKAVNPGLVYDAGEVDYIKFLCGQGYTEKMLQLITGDKSRTCYAVTKETVWDLNLPSFAIAALSFEPFNQTFTRTVTNVGTPSSMYKATITAPRGLKVQVEPSQLSFNSLGHKLSFVLKVEGVMARAILSASLVWDDGKHQARSPIVAYPTS